MNDINDSNKYTFFYLMYIILFFIIIFIVYKMILNLNYYNEKFENVFINTNLIIPNTMSSQEFFNNSIHEELKSNKNTSENQEIYINQNFDKINPSKFNYEFDHNFNYPHFDSTDKKFIIINNQVELNEILEKTNKMKNFYIKGDIVTTNSTFDISKDDICYKHDNTTNSIAELKSKYPNCMVCDVESENKLFDSKSWKNTHTNISKICLFNPNATVDSGIPNLNQCKSFCNIK